jgi:excisionase family DNA binding protein
MGALARQMVGHLSSLRRSTDVDEARPILRQVPPNGTNGSTQPPKAAGPASVEAPHLLRSHEVATIFDVTERTVINWAAAGKLPSLRTIGGHLRFRRDDVMRLVSGADELR